MIFFFLLTILTSCKSPRKETKEAFDTVNKSLEESARLSSSSVEDIYRLVKKGRSTDTSLIQMADTVYWRFQRSTAFIENLQRKLKAADSAGENLLVAGKLLIQSGAGSQLRNLLINLYEGSKGVLDTLSNLAETQPTILSFEQVKQDPRWLSLYFDKTPTVGAITMLSKIENDCNQITLIVLRELAKVKAG